MKGTGVDPNKDAALLSQHNRMAMGAKVDGKTLPKAKASPKATAPKK